MTNVWWPLCRHKVPYCLLSGVSFQLCSDLVTYLDLSLKHIYTQHTCNNCLSMPSAEPHRFSLSGIAHLKQWYPQDNEKSCVCAFPPDCWCHCNIRVPCRCCVPCCVPCWPLGCGGTCVGIHRGTKIAGKKRLRQKKLDFTTLTTWKAMGPWTVVALSVGPC